MVEKEIESLSNENEEIKEEKIKETNDKIEKGTVKWFSPRKGYGFIIRDEIDEGDENKEIFVHYSQVKMEGFKTLLPELRVQFQVASGLRDGSIEAKNVEIIPRDVDNNPDDDS